MHGSLKQVAQEIQSAKYIKKKKLNVIRTGFAKGKKFPAKMPTSISLAQNN